jgi:hypothetical protein
MYDGIAMAGKEFEEYVENSDFSVKWPDWSPMQADKNFLNYTSLMEYPNNFSVIMAFDLPDEVVIRSFETHNALFGHTDIAYSDEDIAALLTRCEATVLAHFASPYAIVIHDRVYTSAWIYRNTVEGYRAAGITPAMIQEKLPLWQEFGFTDEARAAFEGKLTEFVGVEVSLARE